MCAVSPCRSGESRDESPSLAGTVIRLEVNQPYPSRVRLACSRVENVPPGGNDLASRRAIASAKQKRDIQGSTPNP